MHQNKEEKNKNNDNVYALNGKDETVFVREVEKGRNGYFCRGCKRPMQAVHSKIDSRKWYFRHDVKAMVGQPKCTYSDIDHRHNLAQLALLSIKKIKVPPVYKYPTNENEGMANLLSEARFIEGYFVDREMSFFEDDNGIINISKARNIKGKLLIRPDITFFDIHRKPILLVELVATHKLDLEKKLKLKRLGIDTVQVSVPKDSPEVIKNIFYTSENTKWIYNNEQENAKYLPISGPFTNTVPEIDEQQRKFFEETFKCRSAEIGNLIYAITNCLASEQYREIKQHLDSEISRVEENTAREREELGKIHDSRKRGLEAEFAIEQGEVETEGNRIRKAEEGFQSKVKDLEGRYFKKRESIEDDKRGIQKYIKDANSRLASRSSIESIRESIREEESAIEAIEGDIVRARERIESIQGERGKLEGKFEELARAEQIQVDGTIIKESGTIEELLLNLRNQPNEFEENKRKEQDYFERETRELIQRFERLGKDLEHKFDTKAEQIFREMENGEVGKHQALSGEIQDRITALHILSTIGETRRIYQRYQCARKAISEGTWKNWHE